MSMLSQRSDAGEFRRRFKWHALVVTLAFLVLLGRLFYLQVIQGDSFYRLTSDSIVRTELLPAVRGQIRDRKGRVLATPSYSERDH